MIQCDCNTIVASRIQLLVNKNFFHLLFFRFDCYKNRKLTTSENALHFGMKCSKLRGFWGSATDPAVGAYDAPPGLLVGRGFLPSAIAASRLRRMQFPRLTCYMPKAHNIFCPEFTPSTTTAPRLFSPPICP